MSGFAVLILKASSSKLRVNMSCALFSKVLFFILFKLILCEGFALGHAVISALPTIFNCENWS